MQRWPYSCTRALKGGFSQAQHEWYQSHRPAACTGFHQTQNTCHSATSIMSACASHITKMADHCEQGQIIANHDGLLDLLDFNMIKWVSPERFVRDRPWKQKNMQRLYTFPPKKKVRREERRKKRLCFQVLPTCWAFRHQVLSTHRAWGQTRPRHSLQEASQNQNQWQHHSHSNQNEGCPVCPWEAGAFCLIMLKRLNLIQKQRLDGASKAPSHHALADGSALGCRCLDSLRSDPDLTATLAVADANARGFGFAVSFTAFLKVSESNQKVRFHWKWLSGWTRDFETMASTGRGMPHSIQSWSKRGVTFYQPYITTYASTKKI